MNIHELIHKIITESDSADQAHKLGLSYAGRGYWRDSSGKTVAKTVQDKLVKLDADDNMAVASKTSRPLPKDLAKDLVSVLKNMVQGAIKTGGSKENVLQVAHLLAGKHDVSPEDQEEIVRRVSKMYDRAKKLETGSDDSEYRNPDFGKEENRPKLREAFTKLIGQSRNNKKATQQLVYSLFRLLNVSPSVSREIKEEKFPDLGNGNTTEATYYIGTENIVANKKTLKNLHDIAYYTPDEIEEMLFEDTPFARENLDKLRSVHVLIHELCHAKDGSLPKILNAPYIMTDPMRFSSHLALTEGLNERIARQITWSCFSDDLQEIGETSAPYQEVMFQSYGPEVRSLVPMLAIRPEAAEELWALQSAEEREEYIKKFIQTDFFDFLSKECEVDVKKEFEDRPIDPQFALRALIHGRLAELRNIAINPRIPRLDKKEIIRRELDNLLYKNTYIHDR